ncbi:MAG: sulfotransferase [Desulfobacteraceae bacterium]|nr:sulfotransferase [Desulfobacteraceae bacterium]
MQFNFLLCSERSGSNLITKILDAHPEVCGPFPRHAIRYFAPNSYRYGDLDNDANWKTLVGDITEFMNCGFSDWMTQLTVDQVLAGVQTRTTAAVIRYFYEYEARAQHKEQLFVKENHAYELLSFTLSHFNTAKFVWLVRDPRDMALTWKESTAHGGVRAGSRMWLRDQGESLKTYGYLSHLKRIIRVRFEDLVTRPETEAARICDFLGLAYSDDMLKFHEKEIVRRNADKNILGGWKDLKSPIMPENVGRYKTLLSDPEIRYVEALCRHEMECFGYQPDFNEDSDIDELERQLPNEVQVVSPERAEIREKYFIHFARVIEKVNQRKLYI